MRRALLLGGLAVLALALAAAVFRWE